MNRIYFTLGFFCLMAFTALADCVVVFNAESDWPESLDIETPGFGPMPSGYYIMSKDDVEVEFQMNDELDHEHDAYYFNGKMNIWSPRFGIKSVSFTYPQACNDASVSLLYASNYQYIQSTASVDGEYITVFEFLDMFRDYVGLEGNANIRTISVTLDDGVSTGVTEGVESHEVAMVRYFDMTGHEMLQPCGLTIRYTTYCDGSATVEKLLK